MIVTSRPNVSVTRRVLVIGAACIIAMTTGMTAGVAPALAKGPTIAKAVFAKDVTKDFKAQNPTTSFSGAETVHLLLEFKGRPKKGKVEGVWRFNFGDEIGRATVDFASANGSLFSGGGNTFVKFFLRPEAGKPLPVGPYKVDVAVDGLASGSFKFKVIQPSGSIPTKFTKAVLATSADAQYNPVGITTSFKRTDTVNLVFKGTFGVGSWLQATWTVAGKVDPAATRSLTFTENGTNIGGAFNYLPANGWPVGKHQVELMADGVVVGKYPFTVK
jgi:hypothetical protein